MVFSFKSQKRDYNYKRWRNCQDLKEQNLQIYNFNVKRYVYYQIIVTEYNNTYQRTIKMKHANIKSVTYTDCVVENNDKDSKLKHDDHVKISK